MSGSPIFSVNVACIVPCEQYQQLGYLTGSSISAVTLPISRVRHYCLTSWEGRVADRTGSFPFLFFQACQLGTRQAARGNYCGIWGGHQTLPASDRLARHDLFVQTRRDLFCDCACVASLDRRELSLVSYRLKETSFVVFVHVLSLFFGLAGVANKAVHFLTTSGYCCRLVVDTSFRGNHVHCLRKPRG